FPNDQLFPKRGKEINFTVNGKPRILRGESGESAIVKMNGKVVNINTPLEPNCEIIIESSTAGEDATGTIEELKEYTESTIVFEVNRKVVTCPRFVEVNGVLEPPYYQIQEGDKVETRGYYTLEQLAEFMDVELDMDKEILVNNRDADMNTLVYENFSVEWTIVETRTHADDMEEKNEEETEKAAIEGEEEITSESKAVLEEKAEEGKEKDQVEEKKTEQKEKAVQVTANGETILLLGKKEYVYVDVFEYIDFNLNDSRGRNIVTHLNGKNAEYTAELNDGDVIDIYWEETE
ncbi:MAG: cell division protein FtsA, partial [Lachnospiraceae bacterium]|nr:cell division protein FtsA [Lachnospiraceae bacterium]